MPARTLTHDGLTLTIRQWANLTGQTTRIIYWRLSQGWTVEQTLTTPKWKRVAKPVTRHAHIETEFHKLVCSIDGALRVYRKRVGSLVFGELDRGVAEKFARNARDRCSRVTQDRA
ncbi:hypothetical protein ACVWWG_007205 [Bradyrhizobium sp. LB7.2]